MYKFVKREQKLQELLASMPQRTARSKKTLHIIDRAYRHPHFTHLGPAQKQILNLTLNQLIENEKKRIAGQQKQDQRVDCEEVQRKLQNYGTLYSQTPTRSLHMQSTPQLTLQQPQQENRVYIERKYNYKLCYQLHAIIQATNIEQQVKSIKNQLATHAHDSPLITNLQKYTQTDLQLLSPSAAPEKPRTTHPDRPTRNTHNSQPPKNKDKDYTLANTPRGSVGSSKLLSEGYARPTVPNNSQALKKYTSTFYASESRQSPKK